ncbi:MAG: DnaD domain protein [Chloroflexota bacterium]
MEKFAGFPSKMQFTPIPNLFLSSLLPQISDISELKTTLHIFRLLYGKRGYPRFVTFQELLADHSLVDSFSKETDSSEELHKILETAVKRGIILHLAIQKDGASADLYFLNTDTDRQAMAKIQSGELKLSGIKAVEPVMPTEELPDIFTLYEENIGMLTPMIAEELREAEKLYPKAWIRDAIKQAVIQGKRNWRYIVRILELWTVEGKSNGTHQRDSKKADPDKYIKGKYGHIVGR